MFSGFPIIIKNMEACAKRKLLGCVVPRHVFIFLTIIRKLVNIFIVSWAYFKEEILKLPWRDTDILTNIFLDFAESKIQIIKNGKDQKLDRSFSLT